jgi:Tol biopolymer transport system component
MLRNILIIVAFLLTVDVALANPVSEGLNFNVTSLDKTIHIEKGFTVTSMAWSHDGQYILVSYSKSDSPSNNAVKHYLFDLNSHTFGEIDYGIKGSDTNGILQAKWTPSGNKIYFGVSKLNPTNTGYCYTICNPNGTNLKCIGTNFTDLSNILNNLGNIGFQRNLNWSPDSSKIVFEWQVPGNALTGVFIANIDGTNARELQSRASARHPEPVWYDSDKIFLATDEGTVVLVNERDDLIRTFQTENKDEIYCAFSLSPDRKKILLASGSPNSYDFHTYISNTDGSKLKGNVSYYDGSNPDDTDLLTKEFWQPNRSLLLVNQNGYLYIVEGDENNKRLLYEGNASEPQWFPDGKKILFIESKNKLYSIDVDGTNLSFITNLGPIPSYAWNFFGGGQHFSISPSGDIIAFTSALDPATGKIYEKETNKIIEIERDPTRYPNIAAPLFIVNSNGSNLTQVTPSIKGKFDIFTKWNPDGKKFTFGSQFLYITDWEGSLVELNSKNSSSVWENLPVREIIGSEEPATVGKTQSNESNSTNILQVTEHKEPSMQSSSFIFLQVFACILGIWLLHKRRKL